MKNVVYILLGTLFLCYSCKKDHDDDGYKTHTVTVQLVYPENSGFTAAVDVPVKMSSKASSYDAKTDASGKAVFTVPVDIYDISATDTRIDGGRSIHFNGLKSGVTVTENWSADEAVNIDLEESQTSQIVIKELYVGGVQTNDGSGAFLYDRYAILYNNSDTVARLGNLCLATTMPYNATGTNAYYGADGHLSYENEGWVPAGQAIWHFQQDVEIQPGKQIVVALTNAVNNTITYTKSINFDNAEYYCMYDVDDFNFAAAYPAPAASIPSSHYLKAEKYGAGTAWTLSNTSPGFFIFNPEGYTPASFAADASRTDAQSAALVSKKVDVDWVVDGVEAFQLNNDGNHKRLTATIDAGYVEHGNREGYSIYRNVDEEATKAIAGNESKLVRGYTYGTGSIGGTTDPSGIDAEASIKNGARIIYKDTNNSSNDFHLRSQASLRNP